MGLDDLKKKAEGVVSSDKVEEVSDKVLDKAAEAAKKVTGGKFDSQVDSARDAADKAIGDK
ncbi:MAG: antitoxin [Actinomyces succiniciruminis]|uniref:Antitoxin rv0909/mt0933 n=2 Tax=Actinomyces TaxID=1654 RepID=A0A1M4S3R0_9ACTO|nr:MULTISPECIES: Rv0909 family putative TA system antitoxin [Actinomyces]MBE6475902.1 antitoxin [Actinomyces succiniciruminis]MBM6980025.1 antitoxin [Actinomyces succiniciruminis]CED90554.1 MT0933-like antitoxin protein [Actinomyces succiniciruminis]SHE26831.1 antitoxin rv0909/mt0933 [Actinomyces glycerinitolerans]